ncbi:MAG: hypothetical protein ACQESR_22660 [Planctomycetota bacterium]
MPHVLFHWNDEITEYIAQHGVTPEEFEEVVLASKDVRTSRSSGRPIVFGETSTGKYLACVFEYIGHDEVVAVTAYEIDEVSFPHITGLANSAVNRPRPHSNRF